MNNTAQPYHTYEKFMQLNQDQQLAEILRYGRPVGIFKEKETPFTNAVLYQYSHFHVEVTFTNWQEAKSVFPILVLQEYGHLSERYSQYYTSKLNQ